MRKQYLHLLAQTWRFAEEERWKLVLTTFMFVVGNGILMLEPYVLGLVLNTVQQGGPDMLRNLFFMLLLYSSVTFGFWIFHGPARIMERRVSFVVTTNLRKKLFQIALQKPLKWHKSYHTGETIDRISKASGALREFSDQSYVYLETVVRFLTASIAIILLMPVYGAFAFGFGLLVMFIIFFFNKKLVSTHREINEREHGVASMLHDYLGNIVTIITLRLQMLAEKEFAGRMLKVFPVFRQNIVYNEWKWFLVAVLLSLLNISLLFLYVFQRVRFGEVVLVGSLMTLYQYLTRFTDVFVRLSSQYDNLLRMETSLRTADLLLESQEGALEEHQLPQQCTEIAIRNVMFRYEDPSHHVHHLQDIDMNLAPGKKIALVGESGSGKSTLLSILRGLEKADSGEMTVDGTATSLSSLASITTLIPQQPELFDATIRFNITAGLEYPEEELQRVCELACFTKVMERLPQGLDTPIKEKGVNLSGGEKQRLALARGILAATHSQILLLDEPTSSMDSVNEAKIYKNMFSNFADRCIISSIHRLHLLHSFNEIYVLAKGKVVERGSLNELLAANGQLKRMWDEYQESSKD